MRPLKDLSGQVFGQLTVIKRLLPQVGRHVKYVCRCSCGNDHIASGNNLKSGSVASCGQHLYDDLTGKTFGNLICETKGSGYRHRDGIWTTWICQCKCGNKVEVRASSLVSNHTKSCGCTKRARIQKAHFRGYKEISGSYWGSVTGNARRRDLRFEVTKEQVWDIYERQGHKCALSGVPIIFSLDKHQRTASIDRIDSSLGYTISNIQIVHRVVNKMKNNFNQNQFIEMCGHIHRTHNSLLS